MSLFLNKVGFDDSFLASVALSVDAACLEFDADFVTDICEEGCLVLERGLLIASTASAGASTLFVLVSKRAGCGDSSLLKGTTGTEDLPLPSNRPLVEDDFVNGLAALLGGVSVFGGRDFDNARKLL